MSLGGFGLRAWLLKEQLHTKPCERCGLHYDHREAECPHCSTLGPEGLQALLAQKALEREGNRPMGLVFLVIGALLAAFVLLGVLAL